MKRNIIIISIVLIAAASRLLPHPYNFSPVAAMALFSGAYLSRRTAILLPLMSLLIGDVVMGLQRELYMEYFTKFYFLPVYISFILVTLVGARVGRNVNPISVAAGAVGSSLLFYLVTNFGVWFGQSLYPSNFSGIVQSYVMAIPFYKFTLLGDICYSTLFFGAFYLIQKRVPTLQHAHS